MPSALAGAFDTYTITYNVASGTSFDALGNPIEVTNTATFKAILKQAGAQSGRRIAEMTATESARESDLLLEGRCADPVTLPAEVQSGTRCCVTINGKTGELYIVVPAVSPIGVITTTLGQKFYGRFNDGG